MRSLLVAALLTTAVALPASGHGGGLDKNGCHTNRKTGDYHCHGGPAPARSPTPQRISSAVMVNAAPTTGEKDLTRAAQTLLRALGYRPSLLGSLDESTRTAIRTFQRAENLEADGLVDEYLVLRLAEKVAAKCGARAAPHPDPLPAAGGERGCGVATYRWQSPQTRK